MNRRLNISGFSLVELIVVLSILSVFLTLTVPRFFGPEDGAEALKEMDRLIQTLADLREEAFTRSTNIYLHIDPVTGDIWRSDRDTPDPEKDKTLTPLKTLAITDIRFPENPNQDQHKDRDTGIFTIGFFTEGYTTPAMFLLSGPGTSYSLKLSPFLSRIVAIPGKAAYDDCP